MADESLYLMSPTEVAWGYVFGQAGALPPPSDPAVRPREALEQVVLRALLRPPCGVAFSGGRDSSVVLAVATHVARRHGLPDPVAITKVFPGAPRTEERDWQELVVRHLELSDWQRVPLSDELDLIGPLARTHLVDHGVVWPPTIHGDAPVVQLVSGGSLIDGEGGDEVLGVEAHRIAPVTYLLRTPRPLRWRRIRRAARAIAPGRARAELVRRSSEIGERIPWLRSAAQHALQVTVAAAESHDPLSYAASVRRVPRRRTQVLGSRNRRILARSHGVEVSSPLLDAEFVHALARDGRLLGRGDRTATLRALVPDLLPDALLARTTKAEFGGAFWTDHARCFAENWNGDGLDERLVDAEVLRRVWLSDEHNALSAALLQRAWLAARRVEPAAAT